MSAALLTPKTCLHLDQTDLAHRWRISPRTLEQWRWKKVGPRYLKLGGRVVYRIEDVESYEAAQLHAGGAVTGGGSLLCAPASHPVVPKAALAWPRGARR
jgi:hypothetical protein